MSTAKATVWCKALLDTLFGVSLSRGSVNRLREQVSEAIAAPVASAQQYVQVQKSLHSDETRFRQGNGDGLNPNQTKGWLWVLVTPLVSFFFSGAQSLSIHSQDPTG